MKEERARIYSRSKLGIAVRHGTRTARRGEWLHRSPSCLFLAQCAPSADLRENSTICARQQTGSGKRGLRLVDQERVFQFHTCCVFMTYNETQQLAIPHRDNRIPNSHVCLSGSRKPMTVNGAKRERRTLRRIRHGIARATEGLRELRLPLVSSPDSRERVLQGM